MQPWILRRLAARAAPIAIAAAATAIAAGCGGGTKTVTASSSAPAHAETTRAASSTVAHGAAKPGTSTAAAPSTTSTPAANGGSTTRTAPEPAFAQGGGASATESSGAEAATAVAAVKANGYTPNETSEYHPDQTLRVLTATRTGSADGYSQRAFFFVDGRYIGTDASAPSASVRVVQQSDTEVVLAYSLYRAHDPLCCPGGGEAKVHFQLNDGRLVALQPIPPVDSAAGLSRQ